MSYPHQIFFRKNETFSPEIKLTGEEVTHLKSLRLFQKDKILEFRNGLGDCYRYSILSQDVKGNVFEFERKELIEKDITIAVAMPKSQNLDLIFQKGTEIGVTEFILTVFNHSERKEYNEVRSERIILSACAQSRRHSIPKITLYKSINELIQNRTNLVYLHPYSNAKFNLANDKSVIPLIGPEAGFSKEELNIFQENSITGFTLGNTILRIETAFLSVASIMSYNRLNSIESNF